MKTALKLLAAFAALIALSICGGSLDQNYFLGIGLAVVMISSAVSIASASRSGLHAWRAAKQQYEPPEHLTSRSAHFKFTAGMMGVNQRDPLITIREQISELQNVAAQDEKNWRKMFEMVHARIDICLARQDFHEKVTLPKILGASSGTVIISTIMAFIGSAYLAYPDKFYDLFQQAYFLLISPL